MSHKESIPTSVYAILFGIPTLLVAIALVIMFDMSRVPTPTDARYWTHLPPPKGSPYAGCAMVKNTGVVCWLPPQSPTCTSPDGVELP